MSSSTSDFLVAYRQHIQQRATQGIPPLPLNATQVTQLVELLKNPTTIPPITPAIIPENKGAPEANAIPKHNGSATKKTTKPAAKSDFKFDAK